MGAHSHSEGQAIANGDERSMIDSIVVTNTQLMSSKLVVVSPERIYFSDPSPEVAEQLAHAIETGAKPADLLASGSKTIELAKLKDVKAQRDTTELEIRWKGMIGSVSSQTLSFDDPTRRDAILDAIEIQLLPRVQRQEKQFGRVRASLFPLVGIAITGGLGWNAYGVAAKAAAGTPVQMRGGKARALVWLAEALGRGGVIVVVGVLLAIFIGVLVMRIRKPPFIVKLIAG
ncbi:MAG: hypothetical protein IT435_08365 [Phycisphaerales bacterium]|nr:hypothetical protein [Phycisphaerales bacterium]